MALAVVGWIGVEHGAGRALAALALAAVIWTAGLFGQWSVVTLCQRRPGALLRKPAVAAFGALPAVGLLVLVAAARPSPNLTAGYAALWAVGFVAFILLLGLLVSNAYD